MYIPAKQPLKVYRITSRSNPDAWHTIELHINDKKKLVFSCDCEANVYKPSRECYHIAKVKEDNKFEIAILYEHPNTTNNRPENTGRSSGQRNHQLAM